MSDHREDERAGLASPPELTVLQPTFDHASVDETILRELVGDDLDLMRDLIDLFRTEGPRLLALIADAVESRDAAALQQAAHALKGSAGSMAAQITTEIARELEIMGGDARMSEAPQAVVRLGRELERVYAALERIANVA